MTPTQCRMARAALQWSAKQLAEKSGVAHRTISRFESGEDAFMSTVQKLQATFEAEGISFQGNCVCIPE